MPNKMLSHNVDQFQFAIDNPHLHLDTADSLMCHAQKSEVSLLVGFYYLMVCFTDSKRQKDDCHGPATVTTELST